MDEQLRQLSKPLASVLLTIGSVVAEISEILRSATSEKSGTNNAFGDDQLAIDMEVDRLIFSRLGECSAVAAASSEEQPGTTQLRGSGYSVAFDPLDGSSILSANLAVGSIFGVWHGSSFVGSSCRQQVAAAYAVYGPRTLLIVARPRSEEFEVSSTGALDSSATGGTAQPSSSNTGSRSVCQSHVVTEWVLGREGKWALSRDDVKLEGDVNIVAPANMRAAAGNEEYNKLLQSWILGGATLRYTGGMVPDVHHMLAKGGGIFCNPCSTAAPPKLRLLYECAPLALIVEAAHGASTDGHCSLLDRHIDSTETRSKVCLGSLQQVEASLPAMRAF